jgi:hypothetical protein
MAKTKSYEVEMSHVAASGAKKTMWRAGRQFEVKVPQVLDLTKEEVEAFENDKRFTIKEASESSSSTDSSETTSDSEVDTSTTDSETSEEDDSTEDSSSEDTDSSDTEEASDEDTEVSEDTESQVDSEEVSVDQLVKDNSRAELNALAKETGIENPEALSGKPEVAQAIVDAKASNPAEDATS